MQDLPFCISARENLGSRKASILCWYHTDQNVHRPLFVWHILASLTLDRRNITYTDTKKAGNNNSYNSKTPLSSFYVLFILRTRYWAKCTFSHTLLTAVRPWVKFWVSDRFLRPVPKLQLAQTAPMAPWTNPHLPLWRNELKPSRASIRTEKMNLTLQPNGGYFLKNNLNSVSNTVLY